MTLRTGMSLVLLILAMTVVYAQNVPAAAVGQSLSHDLDQALTTVQAHKSPWEDPAARPQPEPLTLLLSELPGGRIWNAFRPVDNHVREAYRSQQQGYIVKDAGVVDRREACALLTPLRTAIIAERRSYPRRATATALFQLGELDNALKHMEYYSALCVLWSMADVLGLWDRQAALEIAADHLSGLRDRYQGRANISDRDSRRLTCELSAIEGIIEAAVAWQAPPDIGPAPCNPYATARAADVRHFANPAVLGGAFQPWRDGAQVDPACNPMTYDETHAAEAFASPARLTRCLSPCARRYRDWQYVLEDFRYGWIVNTHTAASGPWDVNCDWRRLPPLPTWPGAQGAENAGGL
jgi:hypothetical protein